MAAKAGAILPAAVPGCVQHSGDVNAEHHFAEVLPFFSSGHRERVRPKRQQNRGKQRQVGPPKSKDVFIAANGKADLVQHAAEGLRSVLFATVPLGAFVPRRRDEVFRQAHV